MKIGFIAYDTNHPKSDQVMTNWSCLTSKENIEKSKLIVVPYVPRKPREVFFSHRPDQDAGAHPQEIAKRLKMDVERCDSTADIPRGLDYYVVLGVGLLPDGVVQDERVVNAHPGLIPYSRGLDSFKWSIYSQREVGVTLHRLSPEVDMGDVWAKRITPVYQSDTLESFARRHYELEIMLLSNFEGFVGSTPVAALPEEANPETRRMPWEKEQSLMESFEEYKTRYAK